MMLCFNVLLLRIKHCSSIRQALTEGQEEKQPMSIFQPNHDVSFAEFQRLVVLASNSNEVKDAMGEIQKQSANEFISFKEWRMQLQNEFKNKPPNLPSTPFETHCESKSNTMSLIQGFITFEVKVDNVASTVIQMICGYLFQTFGCFFLSEAQSSGQDEFEFFFFQNYANFQPFKSEDVSAMDDNMNISNFKPFNLEYECSFSNVQLTEMVKHYIIFARGISGNDAPPTKYTKYEGLVHNISDIKGGYAIEYSDCY
eukprot:413024_1